MKALLAAGEKLPKPLKSGAAKIYSSVQAARNANFHVEKWNGYEFKFGYWDRVTLGASQKLVDDGKIGKEGVPLEYLDIPSSRDGAIDIGAHFGAYTIPLSVINTDVRVFSFEPDPYNFETLNKNIDINMLLAERTKSYKCLVSDHSGSNTFYQDTSRLGPVAGTMNPVENNADYTEVELDVISVSEFCRRYNVTRPWVKIDAEGEELRILTDLLEDEFVESVYGFIELHLNRKDVSKEEFDDIADGYGLSYKKAKETYEESNPGYVFRQQ